MQHTAILPRRATARTFTVTELMNEGRENPLSDDSALRLFMWLDRTARTKDRRCPEIGAPDMRHPLDRMFARAAANGVQVVIGVAA
ncbi:MAG: hypothetical protein J7498_05380 [Sphingobium sp.]|nr:hypothetical protein [Sphingobium sp.]